MYGAVVPLLPNKKFFFTLIQMITFCVTDAASDSCIYIK